MSYGPSDEVAEDYRKALEDLTINSRYEISNLTVIAKENTEHAFAIAEALKSHIKQTAPTKKLPAFYVLDSVVKNVGTPYTLFFGRQLYSTFMEAYALVDNSVRRKMDEMLKTWKEPVPGSMDTRPVFPPEVTRPIENALIKAKTSFLQTHQENMRNQQQLTRGRPLSALPYQQTPTPPNVYRPLPPNHMLGYGTNYQQQITPFTAPQPYSTQQNEQQPYGLPPRPQIQQYTQQTYPSQSLGGWQQPPSQQVQGYYEAGNSVEKLNSDLDALINSSKIEWGQRPYDTTARTRLTALLDLQTILRNQTLPLEQIAQIKQQVEQLSQASQVASISQPSPAPLPPPVPVVAAQRNVPQTSLSSILGPGALAALIARQSATPSTAPQILSPQQPQAQPYQPPPASIPAATPVPNASSLLDSLRAAGLLGTSPAPPNAMSGFPTPSFLSTPPTTSRPILTEIPNDVVLKTASLKVPRPHLISRLYERLGIPCTQCGRRFQMDESGKKKKEAHMDWHFKVRQRMEDAESRGQHRSWYVDELDWIKSRETDDESGAPFTDTSAIAGTTLATTIPKPQYLPVPDDSALRSSLCPICQEKFETQWLDEAQEFVWMDARQVGNKIYHATCYAEATKDVNSQIKRGTPEPVLGKRKAEDDYIALRTKIKTETD